MMRLTTLGMAGTPRSQPFLSPRSVATSGGLPTAHTEV
jgi:hypothetical protein